MDLVNYCKCQSIKNKKDIFHQCTNNKKCSEDFCGIHLKDKKRMLYIDVYNEYNKKICIEVDNEISVEKLFKYINNDSEIKVNYIRNVIRKTYLKNFISPKQSKKILINEIKNFMKKERYYQNNLFFIILIQSYVRRWIIYRRSICHNDEDILYSISKYDIDSKYFYRFKNNINNKYYAYDIRSLYELINSNYPSCPYTLSLISNDQITVINDFVNKLEMKGLQIKNDVKLDETQELEMEIKDLFYKINMLDNYTNHKWFSDLDLELLITLYIKTEDIWNYRSLLSETAKKNIIGNDKIFQIPIFDIQKEKSKKNMQKILLKYFNSMVSNGKDINEKKLGAILVLSGLVEVSHEASLGLPHLIQM